MNAKINLMLSLCLALLANNAYSQGTASANRSFQEVRRNDFTRLLGIETNFEGVTIKYDKDKAVLNFGQGIGIADGTQIINISGSVGTSTDVSKLFEQNTLPVFSLGVSYNFLIGGTMYYYDGAYTANFPNLEGSTRALSSVATGAPGLMSYRQQIRQNIRSGKYDAHSTVHSFKELYWIGINAKYNNNQYGFFDNARAFKQQQYDTSFQTFTGQLSINGYMGWNNSDFDWNGYRPEFLFGTIYGFINKSNNIGELKKVPVNDIRESIIDSPSNTTRQVLGKNQSYYRGNYYEFYNVTAGAKVYFSPAEFFTLSVFGEYRFIIDKDKQANNLNDNGNFGAGIFFYTGKNSKSSVNIGFDYKRVQNNTDRKWTDRIELVTSIPVNIFR